VPGIEQRQWALSGAPIRGVRPTQFRNRRTDAVSIIQICQSAIRVTAVRTTAMATIPGAPRRLVDRRRRLHPQSRGAMAAGQIL
jgi:hypothetical protein